MQRRGGDQAANRRQGPAVEPHSLVWVRVLRRFPKASRVQVAVSEALVDFPRANMTELAERLKISRSTLSRVVNTDEFTKLHAAYLLERKDLCREDFRRAMGYATERVAQAASRRGLEGEEIALLKLAGEYTGELKPSGAQIAVAVAGDTVQISGVVGDAIAHLRARVTPSQGDSPSQVPALQAAEVE